MSKRRNRIKFTHFAPITLENLTETWAIVHKTCKNKRELYFFSLNLQANLWCILKELRQREYTPGKFRCFMIFEPKPRLVMSQSVKDKIVNHFIANQYLLPLLEFRLVDANTATRKHKGSSYAMRLLKKYFAELQAKHPNQKVYALKMDVSKYFYRIDHQILFEKLRCKIKDRDILNILKVIIDETNKPYVNESIKLYNEKYGTDIPLYEQGCGLSIGAMTSQFLAIFYLNDLDHYIKETLGCRYYIRYMDDFLILSPDKDRLKYIYKEIERQLHTLKLTVNPKSRLYNCDSGFIFLGYRHYLDRKHHLHIKCYAKTRIKIRRRLKYLAKHDPEKYKLSLASYQGYFIGESGKKKKRPKI